MACMTVFRSAMQSTTHDRARITRYLSKEKQGLFEGKYMRATLLLFECPILIRV